MESNRNVEMHLRLMFHIFATKHRTVHSTTGRSLADDWTHFLGFLGRCDRRVLSSTTLHATIHCPPFRAGVYPTLSSAQWQQAVSTLATARNSGASRQHFPELHAVQTTLWIVVICLAAIDSLNGATSLFQPCDFEDCLKFVAQLGFTTTVPPIPSPSTHMVNFLHRTISSPHTCDRWKWRKFTEEERYLYAAAYLLVRPEAQNVPVDWPIPFEGVCLHKCMECCSVHKCRERKGKRVCPS